MTTDAELRDELANRDLLPGRYSHLTQASIWEPSFVDPRVRLHERSLADLSAEHQQVFENYQRAESRAVRAELACCRHVAALEWLLETYELDELATDVVKHALDAGRSVGLNVNREF